MDVLAIRSLTDGPSLHHSLPRCRVSGQKLQKHPAGKDSGSKRHWMISANTALQKWLSQHPKGCYQLLLLLLGGQIMEVNFPDIKKQKQEASKIQANHLSIPRDLTALPCVRWSCRIRVKCKATLEQSRASRRSQSPEARPTGLQGSVW